MFQLHALYIFQAMSGSVRMMCTRPTRWNRVHVVWDTRTSHLPWIPMVVLPATCSFSLRVQGQAVYL